MRGERIMAQTKVNGMISIIYCFLYFATAFLLRHIAAPNNVNIASNTIMVIIGIISGTFLFVLLQVYWKLVTRKLPDRINQVCIDVLTEERK